jgi:hypothetical protein
MSAPGPEELMELIKLVGGPSAVAGLGWWLRGKFNGVEASSRKHLDAHEKQDERRHRQNLVKLTRINTKLGIYDPPESDGEHEG